MDDKRVCFFNNNKQSFHIDIKEHKNCYRNDLDDDNKDATATTDVTIAVDNDAVTASVEGDEGSCLW